MFVVSMLAVGSPGATRRDKLWQRRPDPGAIPGWVDPLRYTSQLDLVATAGGCQAVGKQQ